MAERAYLAVDLGASSGRVVAGLFDGRRLRLEEVYRFENGGVAVGLRLYWDLLNQWNHVQRGLRAGASAHGERIRSVGVDTWGVDFGLLGPGDELLANPRHYRDHHTDGILEQALQHVPREEIFAASGLQFMQFNTLYQLWAMRRGQSPLLDLAESFLMVPDLFHWLLTGVKANEFTNATTTQFLDPTRHCWSKPLLERFQLPTRFLGDIIEPGTKLGPLLPQVANETNLAGVQCVVPGTHDTASAVMAVPAASKPGERPDWCYISSGTWSLMGVESPTPIINSLCRQLNFTNEGGVGQTIRVLKNITGMWLLQECRRVWAAAGQEYTWDYLNRMSDEAPPLAALINPDDTSFMAPADMPTAVREYCARTSQPVPEEEGAVIRVCLESLALKYRMVLGWLEQLIDGPIGTIHIVGGGAQNRRLCQAAADACNRRVVAGPVEATAIGNVMVQAIADGAIGSIAQAREIVRDSFSVETYTPRNTAAWDDAWARFVPLCA
ncbi:MAG: rhamnulokinase family protein [Pirellulales bacterium]